MKKRKKPELKPKEREIIRVIHKKGAMTTKEIADVTGISYVTVRKYLESLSKKGVIKQVSENGKTEEKK